MEYIIETKGLTKRYETNSVVDHLNLHVPSGKIYGLLGRNGAGKTTLMKMLLRLTFPSHGTIQLFGEIHHENVTSIYHKIGSMIETPGFYANLTGFENLQILAKLRGKVERDSILSALKIVGLQEERKKVFANYSLGMKQRLGIAAAIMHRPKLLILDEPINGLDPIGIAEIRSFLSKLCREEGITILISSHVLNEIEQIADIIGVMHEGRLVEEVNIEELHKKNRKYILLELSDGQKAAEILKGDFNLRDIKVQGNIIKIYDFNVSSEELNHALNLKNIRVSKINLCEDNLEDYFSKLIGGVGIA